MLIKRTYDPGKGLWGLVGGFIDLGETATESLTREIKEEVGVNIKDFNYFGCYAGIYLYNNIEYQVTNTIYTAHLPNNYKIELSNESSEYVFFDIDKIQTNLVAPEDAKKAIIELVLSKRH